MRLAFSVYAMLKPEILIIDEALAVGDVQFQQKCYSHLQHSLKDCSKLFVTHDLAALTAIADRVLVMDKGQLLFDGNKKMDCEFTINYFTASIIRRTFPLRPKQIFLINKKKAFK